LLNFLQDIEPDWADTQTYPPTSVEVSEITENSFKLSWQAVSYITHEGYYRATCGQVEKQTNSKLITELTFSNLKSNTTYDCFVETITKVHPDEDQNNPLTSIASQIVSATTEGRTAESQLTPFVEVTPVLPVTSALSVNQVGNGHGEVTLNPSGSNCQSNHCIYIKRVRLFS